MLIATYKEANQLQSHISLLTAPVPVATPYMQCGKPSIELVMYISHVQCVFPAHSCKHAKITCSSVYI